MNSVLHTKEQGLRVHKLANLGGLAAIAGLENIDSGLLLGAFLELAAQLPHLGLDQVAHLRAQGLQTLSNRKNKKENEPKKETKKENETETKKDNEKKNKKEHRKENKLNEDKPHEEKHPSLPKTSPPLLLREVTLKIDHIKKLIVRLGGKVPALEKDMIPELYRLMR